MRTALAIVSLLTLCPLIACAADGSGKFIVLGVGGESCGKFVQERRAGRDNPYRGWITGYLTAVNQQTTHTYNILGATDLDGALGWIDNYCTEQPLDTLAAAANALVLQLMPKRRQDRP